MLFNSIEYIVLLAASLALYWLSPSLRLRQWVLFGASVYFYMTWSRVFVVMLLVLVGVNWLIGRRLTVTRNRNWLIFACVLDLALLAYFKYANFFIDNVGAIASLFVPTFETPHLSVILPLGISFYTFELISYLTDIQRGRIEHQRNPIVFALFVLFFPHLIAGPICRAGQFMPQLQRKQRFNISQFYNGCYMFLAGFALKTGIADGIAPFANVIFGKPAEYSGFDNLMATVGFGVQILCDFWGYSLMALGAALMFGFVLPANFNLPYASLSIRDFWRRWHITLSNWLRDYLYITMGGSRADKEWKTQRNLALTMLLGGLWHGASWNFIIWGAIHGGALAINRQFESSRVPRAVAAFFRWKPMAWLLTMTVVFVAWIFFRAKGFGEAADMITRIVTPAGGWSVTRLAPVFFELLLLYLPLQWLVHKTTYDYDMSAQPVWKPTAAVAMLTAFSLIYFVDGNEFIYFQF
ncbi:MBOAT family O-acyltransferase [Cupriavidus necator]|uniref:MBOAT family O-acyltransferase n=1 Tax=Cupriavidus necator TaxID=106590 RepID=UPI003F738615